MVSTMTVIERLMMVVSKFWIFLSQEVQWNKLAS